MRSLPFFCLAILIVVVGCKSEIKYELIPASGSVTINGSPAANIMVQAMPDIMAGVKGPTSSGITDTNGKFQLKTEDNKDGAVPGKHVIVLFDVDEERPAQGEELTRAPRLDASYSTAKGGISFEIAREKPIEIRIPSKK